jgi:MazG family protein
LNTSSVERLVEVMRALRDPQGGCPWDLAQDFRSLAPYTLEEAAEVVDALEHGDMAALRGELGDLLFQVVFLSQLAAERGAFDFGDVANGIADKLVARHPHVFGSAGPEQALDAAWDARKAEERRARGVEGVLADIPRALPALMRAAKLGRRAARVGFDWPDPDGASRKVEEEIREVRAAGQQANPAALEEELGDLLFATCSWARLLKVEPESALRRACAKFERRFGFMEGLAAARGIPLESLDAAHWDALWNEAKAFSGDSSPLP